MNDKEFIEKLIDIRELCADSDCEDCPYAINQYHDCCFHDVPCSWDELEKLLKQEPCDKFVYTDTDSLKEKEKNT